mmetsp:Transcript_26164/g.68849  ORF Transcript_26164/g.68849 Transcript_26164/m.68849 type:complete len:229 (+) Transcript_26164:1779-2465(+)
MSNFATAIGTTTRTTCRDSSMAFRGYPSRRFSTACCTFAFATVPPSTRSLARPAPTDSFSDSFAVGFGNKCTWPPRSQQRFSAFEGESHRGAARAASISSSSPSVSVTRHATSARAVESFFKRYTTNHSSSTQSPVRRCPIKCASSWDPNSISRRNRSRCHRYRSRSGLKTSKTSHNRARRKASASPALSAFLVPSKYTAKSTASSRSEPPGTRPSARPSRSVPHAAS